jgi:hypothetical protein
VKHFVKSFVIFFNTYNRIYYHDLGHFTTIWCAGTR